ncbi:hypothetical protein BUY18_08705 [Staphylococcus cohnii]|nr:hypothetical protein BUY18_08705 [Staphylococcus cohnii]PTG42722.1 hypothetical protein BUY24_01795 [Staphylococcus cohnii]PUZ32614.1 hypothetical protein BUY27_11075 [Staphylococcus cohnii]
MLLVIQCCGVLLARFLRGQLLPVVFSLSCCLKRLIKIQPIKADFYIISMDIGFFTYPIILCPRLFLKRSKE